MYSYVEWHQLYPLSYNGISHILEIGMNIFITFKFPALEMTINTAKVLRKKSDTIDSREVVNLYSIITRITQGVSLIKMFQEWNG